MQDLINDSLRLIQKILSDTFESYILVHIAQSSYMIYSFKTVPEIPTIYGYIIDRTPQFLKKEGIFEIICTSQYVVRDLNRLTSSSTFIKFNNHAQRQAAEIYKKFTGQEFLFDGYAFYFPSMKKIDASDSRGLYYVVVNRAKAEEWIKSKQNSHQISAPQERDYWYEEHQLYMRLNTGGVDQLDFSKAKVSRELFETFLSLWTANGRGSYNQQEIYQKYKDIFKKDLQIGRIGEIVSNIRSKIINPKVTLKDRIEWRFEKKNNIWVFRIKNLPKS